MLLTLKVTLIDGRYIDHPWEGIIEIDDLSTLYGLHLAIQKAVEFDNDHLYEFYLARTPRSRDKFRFDEETGDFDDLDIGSLFPLPERKHLYYMFDWGDSWLFKISRATRTLREPDPRLSYPRLAKETGKKPEQYPEYED